MSSSTPINADSNSNPQPQRRAQLRVFLGYAAGVGKTFRMLEEAQQLKRQGKDVVVGYFEPHGRKDTIAKTAGLEMVPRKTVTYRGVTLEEMDTDAIIQRHPAICVVDELAHTNVPEFRLVTTSPSFCNAPIASRTAGRPTPNNAARSRSEGSRDSGMKRPAAISSRIFCDTCS